MISAKKQMKFTKVFLMWTKSDDYELFMRFRNNDESDPGKALGRLLMWLVNEDKIIIDKEIECLKRVSEQKQ